jgi:sulfur-oxidizing protein SoxX
VLEAVVLAAAVLGDPARGAAIAASRAQGLCVLCHAMPGIDPRLSGTIGPDLAGAGTRHGVAELRARLLTPERFNPQTVMPAYARHDGLDRVAAARRGQPLLTEQQLEDVLAWLATLH